MQDSRACFLLAFLCAGISLLCGCGSGTDVSRETAPTSASKGTVADLRGGWLLTGSMPDGDVASLRSLNLAIDLDVINNKVVGSGVVDFPCYINGVFSGAVGGGIKLEPTTVDTNGNFTLADMLLPTNTQHKIEIKGALPPTPNGSWSGSFTASDLLSSCNGTPPTPQSGTFAAQKIADLNGTFTGQTVSNTGITSVLTTSPVPTSSPVLLTASLQQGGPISTNGVLATINDQNVLNGTISVQGVPCFSKGAVKVTQGIPNGYLLGNHILMEFLMDDSSTLFLTAVESDTAVSKLTKVSFSVMGGSCDKTAVFFMDGLLHQ